MTELIFPSKTQDSDYHFTKKHVFYTCINFKEYNKICNSNQEKIKHTYLGVSECFQEKSKLNPSRKK